MAHFNSHDSREFLEPRVCRRRLLYLLQKSCPLKFQDRILPNLATIINLRVNDVFSFNNVSADPACHKDGQHG